MNGTIYFLIRVGANEDLQKTLARFVGDCALVATFLQLQLASPGAGSDRGNLGGGEALGQGLGHFFALKSFLAA